MLPSVAGPISHFSTNASQKEKRQFFRKFIGKIVLNQHSATIYYNLLNLTANTLKGSQLVGGMASPTGFEPVSSA